MNRNIVLAAAAMLSLTATSARAFVVSLTATGTIDNGYQANLIDRNGVFGTVGASLLGDSLTMTISQTVTPAANGTYYNSYTPTTVTWSINGITVSESDSGYSTFYFSAGEIYAHASDSTYSTIGYTPGGNTYTNLDITQTQTFSIPSGAGDTIDSNMGAAFGNLHLTATATSFTLNAPVPEPATVAILGAGLIGLFAIRRKSTKTD